ncbi:unnamed protein product [Polarella glacialis]|uniref:Uncharacterized protein n=1 Tax=Polarella glacialis TaxID=89957 RepID=A0A813D3C7_POLGL|nr:unnamed protein product [Polarella glacialis]CAE8611899.1 unnamed protein product [Polarella glacialis]
MFSEESEGYCSSDGSFDHEADRGDTFKIRRDESFRIICTLADSINRARQSRAVDDALKKFRLPAAVKAHLRSFFPKPVAFWLPRNEPLVGLHDGRDYHLRGVAKLPAGKLQCGHQTVQRYFANLGHFVDALSEVAVVEARARAGRAKRIMCVLPVDLAVVASPGVRESKLVRSCSWEFAKLVKVHAAKKRGKGQRPNKTSATCEVKELGGTNLEVQNLLARKAQDPVGAGSEQPAPQKKPKPEPFMIHSCIFSIGNSNLHSIAGPKVHKLIASAGPCMGEAGWKMLRIEAGLCELGSSTPTNVRSMLFKGTSPLYQQFAFGANAVETAKEAKDSFRQFIDDVRSGSDIFRKHWNLGVTDEICFDGLQDLAEHYLWDYACLEESCALLRIAARFWGSPLPSARTQCIGSHYAMVSCAQTSLR